MEKIEIIDTGWRCTVCYDIAQVFSIDTYLCIKHAEEYKLGYGKSLMLMKEEFKNEQSYEVQRDQRN